MSNKQKIIDIVSFTKILENRVLDLESRLNKMSKNKFTLDEVEQSIHNLVKQFILKHFDLEDEDEENIFYYLDVSFTRDNIFDVVSIADYWLNMSDIYHDMKKDIPKGKILEWHDEVVDRALDGNKHINFSSYCMNGYNMDIVEGKKCL